MNRCTTVCLRHGRPNTTASTICNICSGPMVPGEYKGFRYSPQLDVEPGECEKIFHDVYSPLGRRVHMDWSSYNYPTALDFEMWIDLGMPTRTGPGPLDRADLEALAYPEKISKKEKT